MPFLYSNEGETHIVPGIWWVGKREDMEEVGERKTIVRIYYIFNSFHFQ